MGQIVLVFVSECNTAVYFSWCLIQALAQPVQLFWPLVTFSVASGNSLTDSDLQLFIETEITQLQTEDLTQETGITLAQIADLTHQIETENDLGIIHLQEETIPETEVDHPLETKENI